MRTWMNLVVWFAALGGGATGALAAPALETSKPEAAMCARAGGTPVGCDLGVFTAKDRERHAALLRHIGDRVIERDELADGYAFRLASDAGTLRDLGEWMALEHACCPFLKFTVEVEPSQGPLWLKLTGDPVVKAFVGDSFGAFQR
jgi:hypothetical protein